MFSSFPVLTPGNARLDEECRKLLTVHLREDDEQVGEPAVGDPHLLAVQDKAAVRLRDRQGLRAQGVRPGVRLAQRVGADRLSAHEARQVSALLFLRAEEQQRDDGEVALRAIGGAERCRHGEGLCHDDRGDRVQLDATIGFGHVDAEQSKRATSAQKMPRSTPVLLFHSVEFGQYFLRDELLRGLTDEAVLVGAPLGCEYLVGRRLAEQPAAALPGRSRRRRHQSSSVRSNRPAAPMPPPTHMVTSPYRTRRRRIS